MPKKKKIYIFSRFKSKYFGKIDSYDQNLLKESKGSQIENSILKVSQKDTLFSFQRSYMKLLDLKWMEEEKRKIVKKK